MTKLANAIERIKTLECPTGQFKSTVAEILDDYGVAKKTEVSFKRDTRFDRDGAEAYCASIPAVEDESLVVLAKTGLDGYVEKVVDTFMY